MANFFFLLEQMERKQNQLEWEVEFQAKHHLQQQEQSAKFTNKDKLLDSLCVEQEELFAKINRVHCRKDAEKLKILDCFAEQCKNLLITGEGNCCLANYD